jgi:hypothetical protein
MAPHIAFSRLTDGMESEHFDRRQLNLGRRRPAYTFADIKQSRSDVDGAAVEDVRYVIMSCRV